MYLPHIRKSARQLSGRSGFNLVELLVVIGITAVLVSLTAPAVQRIRDAAARAGCSNNLRQIAIALHGHHDASKAFPPGMSWQNGKAPMRLSTWMTHILPYIEQEPLWNDSLQAYQQSPRPFNNPPHVGLATVIPIFVCPGDGRGFDVQFATRDKFFVALTSRASHKILPLMGIWAIWQYPLVARPLAFRNVPEPRGSFCFSGGVHNRANF